MDFLEEGSWNLSFAGAGYLALYHVGVIHCLSQHAPRLLQGAHRFYGSSSGALSAISIICNKSVGASWAVREGDPKAGGHPKEAYSGGEAGSSAWLCYEVFTPSAIHPSVHWIQGPRLPLLQSRVPELRMSWSLRILGAPGRF